MSPPTTSSNTAGKAVQSSPTPLQATTFTSRSPTITGASFATHSTTVPSHQAAAQSQFRSSISYSGCQDEKTTDHIVEVRDGYASPEPEGHQEPLELFHKALGIPPPKPVKPPKPTKANPKPLPPEQPKISSANKGVYHQVLNNERKTRIKYYFCNTFVVLAMFLQIIVGASVTAFGAGSASHVLITVFGAANTALASLLAVLKSQGLPNRIRQDWNGWKELREFIEEKEREINRTAPGNIDIWATVKDIEARYHAVILTSDANRPDTYRIIDPKQS